MWLTEGRFARLLEGGVLAPSRLALAQDLLQSSREEDIVSTLGCHH